MSEDLVPEWIRLKNEIVAIWRGAWKTINDLDDRYRKLEERVTNLENEVHPPERWRR